MTDINDTNNKDENNENQDQANNENIKEYGIPENTGYKKNIQFISLIGEIEGHYISSNDKKATKYEHIVPLATSTDFSVIVPSATMTIHPIRTTGLVISGPQTFRYFQKMQQRINNFIVRTSNISEKTLTDLMYASDQMANDTGTILVGSEAVNVGLIDAVGDFSFALSKLDELMKRNNEKDS